MNSFNEPTEKTGYLEQDFRLFHINEISPFFFGKRYVKKLRKPFYLMFTK